MTATEPAAQSGSREFRMPSLGTDMQSGTVVAWRVKPGDRVKRGDIVAEVETEKGVFEVEIGTDGVIDEISVAKGAKVAVGTVLARLRGEAAAAAPPPPAPVSARGMRASPLARKMAEANGIDLAGVSGTGPDGAITKADVERLIEEREKPRVTQPAEAPPAAVKKVVDALRMSWHPDHARNEADRRHREERIKQINAAWDILKSAKAAAA